jgi:hypothetical protein
MDYSANTFKEDSDMKRVLLITALALALSLVVTGIALADDGGTGDTASAGDVALLLAPLVAAATAIERFIEMCFNQVESTILNLGSFLNMGGEYVKWAQGQVEEFQKMFLTLGDEVNKAKAAVSRAMKAVEEAPEGAEHEKAKAELDKVKNEAAARVSAFDTAEDALEDAQDRLVQFLKEPYWVSRKQAIATLAAIVLGVAAAFVGRIRMFDLLNIDLAKGVTNAGLAQFLVGVDMAITGLVIGTGSGPVHSLIGILQSTKDTINKAGKLWKGEGVAALGEVVQPERAVVGGRGGVDFDVMAVEEPLPEGGTAKSRRRIERLLR